MKLRRHIMFLAAMTALIACSCSKIRGQEDEGWTVIGGDTPVSFGSSLAGPSTKSPVSLSTLYNSFRVFAFYQPGVIGGASGTWNSLTCTPNFMYNQEVTYDNETGEWKYTPLKYWPNNIENTISFWAYAPANATVTLYRSGTSTAYSPSTAGLPGIMFTVPSTADTDFLISEFDMVKDHDLNPNYPTYYTQDLSKTRVSDEVRFLFNHALSKVNFQASKEDPENKYDIVINTVSLQNILFTGVKVDGGWAVGSGDRDNFVALNNTDVELTGSNSVLASGKLLMPQRFSRTTAALYVRYKCKNKLADDFTTYECTVPFGDVQASWESSNQYTINIRISPGNPILFTATVVNWDSDINGFFNVNEE